MIASVELPEMRPAATFWICRSAPGAPTETVPAVDGVVPAKGPKVSAPKAAEDTSTPADVVEPEPRATLLAVMAVAPDPSATPRVAAAETDA